MEASTKYQDPKTLYKREEDGSARRLDSEDTAAAAKHEAPPLPLEKIGKLNIQQHLKRGNQTISEFIY